MVSQGVNDSVGCPYMVNTGEVTTVLSVRCTEVAVRLGANEEKTRKEPLRC